MFEISIKSHFCGAHRLKGYQGKCARLHGHNWEVEIFLRGNKTNRLGLLVDFKTLKELLGEVLEGLDHRNLNQLPAFKKENPTAENIARFIFNKLSPKIRRAAGRLHCVRASETPGAAAGYFNGR